MSVRRRIVNECEKRGLSVVEDNQLTQEKITELLWKNLGRTDFVFNSIASKEGKEKEILEAIEEEAGADDIINVPGIREVSKEKERIKQYHIVGLAATRLDDSRKKWHLNKVVMGCDGNSTS
jgi:hypothetical protein